jgi:hypothetical protein
MPLLATASCAERMFPIARTFWLSTSIAAAFLLSTNARTVRADEDVCAALVQRRPAQEPQLFYVKSQNALLREGRAGPLVAPSIARERGGAEAVRGRPAHAGGALQGVAGLQE